VGVAFAQDFQPAGEEWITKWWALDGLITNTGGHVGSAATDWLDKGTDGKLTQEKVSTLAGLKLTEKTIISLPNNSSDEDGELGWTVITITPNDSHNTHNALGLLEFDNYEYYAIIVIDSPNARTTTMHPAHDDYGHIWINGEKVYDNPAWTTGATIVTTPTDVSLAKGQNVLLFRLGESGGDDYINLHFEPEDDDLKILPTMDDKFFEHIGSISVDPSGKQAETWGDVKQR
jgi:hypothetical protein